MNDVDSRIETEAQRLRDENAKREAARAEERARGSVSTLAERLLAEALANVPTSAEEEARRLQMYDAEKRRLERAARRKHVEGSGITVDDLALDLIVRGELDDSVHAFRIVDAWLDVHEGKRATLDGKPPRRWIALSGGTGCGKTTASAWAIARRGGLHAHTALLADAKTSRFAPDREHYGRCLASALLVIDDVGAGTGPADIDRERAMLEHILDARQRAPQLTILTMNLKQGKFNERIGARLVSRFTLHGVFAECKGVDLRRSR